MATISKTTMIMMTEATDMGTVTGVTMIAMTIMIAIRSAAGTALITRIFRPVWQSAIVFLPDWNSN